MPNCNHNARCRYTHGYFCEDCQTFFPLESATYRRTELLSSIWMSLHNVGVSFYRRGEVPPADLAAMIEEIGVGIDHENYEDIIARAEVVLAKFKVSTKSSAVVLRTAESSGMHTPTISGEAPTYEGRLAQAKAYTKSCKIQATASRQKFPRGTLVHVQKKMPMSMSHFESDFDAIVEYSYAQKFGGGEAGQNGHEYSLIQLENGTPINSISWYDEDLLTLVDAGTELGEEILRGWAAEHGE